MANAVKKSLLKEEYLSLAEHGLCAVLLREKEAGDMYPQKGDEIDLLMDNSDNGRYIPAEIVAVQRKPNDDCVVICAPRVLIMPCEQDK